ncbi:hypothetical protein BUALT_Bualt14G0027700 [Buddleja alternifolia]|uniref:Uncharacterized protein n=1 Tax=Buddleja alternifolia TaxID=168488 RepID=A0AAV6WGD8_9LAMI|nr:hypothetical protein BUALT_Bualt14G0027700 [Buddleja alternifolia]
MMCFLMQLLSFRIVELVHKWIKAWRVVIFIGANYWMLIKQRMNTEQLNGPPSGDQISNRGSNNESESVISSNEGLQKGPMKAGQDADFQGEEDKLASEPQTLIAAVEIKEEICDKLDSEVVEHDLTPQSETPQNLDASAEVKNVTDYAEVGHSTETVGEIAPTEGARENFDTFVGVEKVSDSVKKQTTQYSDVVSVVSSIDKEVEQNTSLVGNSDISEREMVGNENRKMGSNDKFSVEAVSASLPEDDQTTSDLGKDLNCFDEKSNSKLLEVGNESGEGAVVEVQLMLESKISTVNSTDFPTSCETNLDAGNLEELSRTESNSLDNSFEKSVQEIDTGKVTEVLQSVGSAEVDKCSTTATLDDRVHVTSIVHATSDDVRVESVEIAESKDNEDVVASDRIPEHPTSKESELLSKSEDDVDKNICSNDGAGASESIDAAEAGTEINHDSSTVISSENSEGPTSRIQEALPVNQKCSNGTSPDVEEKHISEDVSISKSVSSAEATCDVNAVTSNNLSVTPSIEEPIHEMCATADDKNIVNDLNSKSMQDEGDDTPTKQEDDDSNSRSDSLEANCGSVSALSWQSNMAVAETSSQSPDALKRTIEEADIEKSDVFEPPSFMTLVQPGGEKSEIETLHNNQQPKSDALQAGWFPSITNVVNESEGRKKNEEIISKVTNWNPVKQHSPLKTLLNEVHSPNTKQVSAETKDNGNGKSVVGPDAPLKDQETNKVMEEWNSPARYPIEIKKEKKKKGKPYWVQFVCCSSVHRDM